MNLISYSKHKTIFGCLVFITLMSCESHEQKKDEAFENFKEEKMSSKNNNTELIASNTNSIVTAFNKAGAGGTVTELALEV